MQTKHIELKSAAKRTSPWYYTECQVLVRQNINLLDWKGDEKEGDRKRKQGLNQEETEIKELAVSNIKPHVFLKIPTYFPNLSMPDTYVCQ